MQDIENATPLGFQAGLDNRSSETKLGEGAARVATNVDIHRDGVVRRRDGYTLLDAGDYHSLWAHPGMDFMLAVKDNALVTVQEDGTVSSSLATASPDPVSYAFHAGEVYCLSNTVRTRVDLTGSAQLWGFPEPPAPVLSAASSGGLAAGVYQVGYTFRNAAGLESGSVYVSSVTVAADGGIVCTGLPTATGATHVGIYVGAVDDGSVLYRAGIIPAGAGTVNIGSHQPGPALRTRHAYQAPYGQIVRSYRGRIYIASGQYLYWTDAINPHVVRLTEGFLPFPADIDLLEPVEDGIYVAAGKLTYFLRGTDPKEFNQLVLAAKGAVPGTGAMLPTEAFLGVDADPKERATLRSACWWDTDGVLVVGRSSGLIQHITQGPFAAPEHAGGTTFFRETEGTKQVLAVLRQQGTASNAKAQDSVITTVTRSGIVLDT